MSANFQEGGRLYCEKIKKCFHHYLLTAVVLGLIVFCCKLLVGIVTDTDKCWGCILRDVETPLLKSFKTKKFNTIN